MTPEEASEPAEKPKTPPSTAGMTTKVVKGSLWTLAGQVAPLAVSIITTPITIRMLGVEGYGLLALIAVIPNYFLFADLGMGLASTRFSAMAYSEGNRAKEARIVRTCALITLMAALPISAILFIASDKVIGLFNVNSDNFLEATQALRVISVTLVINLLCGVFNSPQLVRLRMDLNTAINASSKIIGTLGTPFVVYLGYGVRGVAWVLLAASLINLAGHLLVSFKLLQELLGTTLASDDLTRLLRFGGSLVLGSTVALFLANIERGILPKMVSVNALAFYTVAFTFVSVATLFSNAMIQSLIPAFSGLQNKEKFGQLQALYSRGFRLLLLLLTPTVIVLAVCAQPFFRIYAGTEFETESASIFHLLLFGLLVNVPAFVPYAAIMASGRTDFFAKLFLAELIPYLALLVVLTSLFGAKGTAVAWSLKTIFEGVIWFRFASSATGLRIDVVILRQLLVCSVILLVPIVFMLSGMVDRLLVYLSLLGSLIIFCLVSWRSVIAQDEKQWAKARLQLFSPVLARILR